MKAPRYRLTDDHLGRVFDVFYEGKRTGMTATIMGWEHGRVDVRFSDGRTDRPWRTAVEARIAGGRWVAVNRTRACPRCGLPKRPEDATCGASKCVALEGDVTHG